MLTAITKWQQALTLHTDLDHSTVTQYIGDAQRFVTWFRTDERGESFADITVQDAKDYRDALVAARRAPATVNRALISLALLLNASGRGADNPFRKIARVGTVEHPPQALTRVEWHAVRRVAERRTSKDHGLALALTCLMRYAGPRVGEVTALQLPDVQLSACWRKAQPLPRAMPTVRLPVRRRDAGAEYGVPLAAAALQFPLHDPRITSTLVGMRQPERIAQTLELAGHPISAALWPRLAAEGFDRADL